MFKKILIANRGEIACRIIRTAHTLGIQCVAIYSDADSNAQHVLQADEAYRVGAAPSTESYLQTKTILQIAQQTGAEAIHPGYGFVSENAAFAKACASQGIVFIGPPVSAIESMGSKATAKKIMQQAKVPLVPGYHDQDQSPATLEAAANKIGFPILLKAALGGGGKGMRIVESQKEFTQALASAKREAVSSFGDDTMLIEKYLQQPRHVELQIFADTHGQIVHLFDRDCSIQRRHQKIIEEAPAPDIDDNIRAQMADAAINAARAINYVGAGTIEFLLDKNNHFYFMEMNTRLQVEHPVTEMITGLDLVEWQLRIAAGEKLPLQQNAITCSGHALEARVYAEDPRHDFLPSVGEIEYLTWPDERIDTGIVVHDQISKYYDPMIAKVICHDSTRQGAIAKLNTALLKSHIIGVHNNVDYLQRIISSDSFNQCKLSTDFIDTNDSEINQAIPLSTEDATLIALYILQQQSTITSSPWQQNNTWRLNMPAKQTINVTVFEDSYEIDVYPQRNESLCVIDKVQRLASATLEDKTLHAKIDEQTYQALFIESKSATHMFTDSGHIVFNYLPTDAIVRGQHATAGGCSAPMTGTVSAVLVNAGDTVNDGDPLVVVEAMKMEHTIYAPTSGAVKEIHFSPGDTVNEGAILINIEEQ